MIDPARYASLICDWCLDVQPGQRVLVRTTTLGSDAGTALQRGVLERGGWPFVVLAPPEHDRTLIRHTRPGQLEVPSPFDIALAETADAFVRIEAPADTHDLSGEDPALLAGVLRGMQPVREIQRAGRTLVTIWPTPALSADARMPLDEYAAFVERAMFLDRPDPISAWRELQRRQDTLIDRLRAADMIRIEAERTDLELSVAGRTWINSDGRRNMPSGEVYTGPRERSATGTIHFDVPSRGRHGVDVRGVTLRFEQGAVVAAGAERGDAYLQAQLGTDPGARFLGELGIGTNTGIDRATGTNLLDEKIAGTIHLALGNSYPETGGTNRSALHWDLIKDLRGGGRVIVDGSVLIEDGAFVGL